MLDAIHNGRYCLCPQVICDVIGQVTEKSSFFKLLLYKALKWGSETLYNLPQTTETRAYLSPSRNLCFQSKTLNYLIFEWHCVLDIMFCRAQYLSSRNLCSTRIAKTLTKGFKCLATYDDMRGKEPAMALRHHFPGRCLENARSHLRGLSKSSTDIILDLIILTLNQGCEPADKNWGFPKKKS